MKPLLETKQHLLNIIIIVVAGIATYAGSLWNGFVWDDTLYFVSNTVYQTADLRKIFFSLANGVEYLPLRDIIYVIDYALWGKTPLGYHLTNLMLVLCNGIAVYALARKSLQFLLRGAGQFHHGTAALIAALLFLLHPIQVQAVNFISCRNVLLSGVFFFLAVLCFVFVLERSDGSWRGFYTASVLLFTAALLSKLTPIILPVLLVLYLSGDSGVRSKRRLLLLVPYFLISAAFFFTARHIAIKTSLIPSESIASIPEKIGLAAQIPFFYLKKLLLPIEFAAEYGTVFDKTPSHPAAYLSAAAMIVLVVAAWKGRRRYPVIFFGVAWYMVALVPLMNFFETNPVVADRYVFIPVFGLFLIPAVTLARLFEGNKILATVVSGAVLCSLAAFSLIQSRVWKNEQSLWLNNIKVAPDQYKGYLNLGLAYLQAGDYERALDQFVKLRKIDPDGVQADLAMAAFYHEKGDAVGARHAAERVLRKEKGNIRVLALLVRSYAKAGETSKTLHYFTELRKSGEHDRWGLRNTASQDIFDAAVEADRNRSYNDALALYLALESSGRGDWQLLYNIGNVYRKMGEFRLSIPYYARVLAVVPGNPDVLNNLGVAYRELQEFPKAIEAFEMATKYNPNSPMAPLNLAVTYMAMHDRDNAVRHFMHVRQRFPEVAPQVDSYMLRMNTR